MFLCTCVYKTSTFVHKTYTKTLSGYKSNVYIGYRIGIGYIYRIYMYVGFIKSYKAVMVIFPIILLKQKDDHAFRISKFACNSCLWSQYYLSKKKWLQIGLKNLCTAYSSLLSKFWEHRGKANFLHFPYLRSKI